MGLFDIFRSKKKQPNVHYIDTQPGRPLTPGEAHFLNNFEEIESRLQRGEPVPGITVTEIPIDGLSEEQLKKLIDELP